VNEVGQKVHTQTFGILKQLNQDFNLSFLPSGFYAILIETDHESKNPESFEIVAKLPANRVLTTVRPLSLWFNPPLHTLKLYT